MLDSNTLQQVKGLFVDLKNRYTLAARIDEAHPSAADLKAFLEDFASTSPQIEVVFGEADEARAVFSLLRNGEDTGIRFRGIPNGHEFTSLLLAVLNADGKGKNLPDEALTRRIQALRGDLQLQTYVSLTCTNCPDVVQALNVMALINPNLRSEMIDGALFQDEVARLNIQAVPSVYVNGELLHIGRGDLGELLSKLEEKFGSEPSADVQPVEHSYDVVVLGGGPAGASAAIYSARKGLHVAVVAGRIGGQVKDTVGIENLISVPQTTGAQLADHLREHLSRYPIDLYENRQLREADLSSPRKRIAVAGGEVFCAPAVIVATGASWRRLNVEGETEHLGRGVHFCPHCDGPFYRGKRVAVVGGGNSGIEAAIDLAGICSHVTVLEFADTLRADTVLQEKAAAMKNIDIFLSSQTTQVLGNGERVTGLRVKDRTNDKERDIALDGIFVQIGLSANTDVFREVLPLNPHREIEVDACCRTSIPGVYAAGDCTNVPYKQIVIAMGEGAKAALSAFDDRMRGRI